MDAAAAGFVGHHGIQVQDHPGTAVSLRSQHRIERAEIDVAAPRVKRQARARQIERDARRVLDRERQRFGCRVTHDERELDPLSRKALDLDVPELVAALGVGAGAAERKNGSLYHECQFHDRGAIACCT